MKTRDQGSGNRDQEGSDGEARALSEAAKTNAAAVRVALPYHLRNLARVEGDVLVEVSPPVTLRAVLDALEAQYPVLRGTIRDYDTGQRRDFLRFFVCEEDWSLESPDKTLPDAVAAGKEPLLILGAIAGG
ncbi:MAG: MoaD/ThiS family protein [Terracidiphilus sp.]